MMTVYNPVIKMDDLINEDLIHLGKSCLNNDLLGQIVEKIIFDNDGRYDFRLFFDKSQVADNKVDHVAKVLALYGFIVECSSELYVSPNIIRVRIVIPRDSRKRFFKDDAELERWKFFIGIGMIRDEWE